MPCNSYPHLSLNYIDIFFLPCKFFTYFSIFFHLFLFRTIVTRLYSHIIFYCPSTQIFFRTLFPLYLLYLSSWFDIFSLHLRPICRLPSFFFLPCYFPTKILLTVSVHKHIRMRKYLYKVYMK